MSTPDVEEQVPVQTPNIEKHRLLRYALRIAAASYVILSSYYISGTRSSLASLAVAQKAAIANLQQRQAAQARNFPVLLATLPEPAIYARSRDTTAPNAVKEMFVAGGVSSASIRQ